MPHSDNDNTRQAIVANSEPQTFISMFSGIEAASVAFTPLGWKAICFAEIDKAASALLTYRYPDTPNVGDMSKHNWSQYRGKVGIVCGGPPCQAFSVAGLRDGLNDARGNLSLEYMKALHAIKPRNAIVENVPGWLTMSDNAFGCFLAGLVGADGPFIPVERKPAEGRSTRWWRWSEKEKVHAVCWPSYGMVSGPKGRAAWAIKDAQFFGLAQRRERVLVVADFGNGADPAAVLFERVSVPWNPPARGEAREGTAHATAPSLTASGQGVERTGESRGQDPVIACANDVGALNSVGGHAVPGNSVQDAMAGQLIPVAYGGNRTSGHIDVATALNDHGGPHGRQDFESETFLVHAIQAGALRENPNSGPDGVGVQADVAYTIEARAEMQAVCVTGTVTHTLTTEGADASEDGTGRGTPIIAFDATQITSKANRSNPQPGDPCHPLAAGAHAPLVIGFDPRATDVPVTGDITGVTAKDYGADAQEDIAPTLRAGGHKNSHQNGGVTPAVAFQSSQSGVRVDDVHATLDSNNGSRRHNGALLGSAVRRLTPRECERLQGFQWQCSPSDKGAWQDESGRWWSPDYTRIPVRKYAKPKITKNRPADMWEQLPNAEGGVDWWLMAADGPRYKQLGNSWAVPKFRWLGERIQRLMPASAANDNTPQAAKAAA